LLLTIRKNVEVSEHTNKLIVDINEDSVDCLLVNYDKDEAYSFCKTFIELGLHINPKPIYAWSIIGLHQGLVLDINLRTNFIVSKR